MQTRTRLLKSKVWHRRETPKVNEFTYGVFYVAHKLKCKVTKKPLFFSENKFNILSLNNKDLGKRDESAWLPWVTDEFKKYDITINNNDEIEVITHPRLFGYAFNPISFWLLLDNKENIKAVLCEVHNTFKDNHNYILRNDNLDPIQPEDVFTAEKKLYVSPFNSMDGYYTFSFLRTAENFKADIIYWVNKEPVVKTAMTGTFARLNSASILGVVIMYPLMTLMVVFWIHWQALKIFIKKIPHTLGLRPKESQAGTTLGKEINNEES